MYVRMNDGINGWMDGWLVGWLAGWIDSNLVSRSQLVDDGVVAEVELPGNHVLALKETLEGDN